MPKERNVEIKRQMGPKDFIGSQRADIMAMKKGAQMVLGTAFGRARGLSFRGNNFDDLPSKALVGIFEFMPADADRPLIRSTRAFFPGSVHDILVEGVSTGLELPKGADKKPPKGKSLEFVGNEIAVLMEVGVRRTDDEDGGKGYEYVTSMKPDPKAVDPLADMRAEIEGRPAPKMIAAPAGKKKRK